MQTILFKRARRVAGVSAVVVMATGLLVMIGWKLDSRPLLSVIPGASTMKFNTALFFVLAAVHLLLHLHPTPKREKFQWMLGGIATMMALWTALSYFWLPGEWLDNLFHRDTLTQNFPGRMSPATAICFFLVHVGLIVDRLSMKWTKQLTLYSFRLVLAFALTSMLAYLFSVPSDGRMWFFRSMAVHTSMLFLLLAISTRLTMSNKDFRVLLLGPEPGSKLFRRLLILAVVMPLISTFWLIERAGNHPAELAFDAGLVGVVFIVLASLFAGVLGLSLNKSHREREALEKALKASNDDLERKNKFLKDFAHVASHELQSPLHTISNFAGMLEYKLSDNGQDTPQEVSTIIRSAKRLRSLVADLLTYSEIGKNRDLEAVDLNAVLCEILEDLQAKIEETNAIVQLGKLPVIQGYPLELQILFRNLVSNGIKYQPPGQIPEVQVHADMDESGWQIQVADNGIGIEHQHQKRIFNAFQRLHNRQEYEGTGIGLAQCRQIVELHGGHILLDSAPGRGSTFTVFLPLLNPENQEGLRIRSQSEA